MKPLCNQCGRGGAELEVAYWPTASDPVPLHRSCQTIWKAAHDAR